MTDGTGKTDMTTVATTELLQQGRQIGQLQGMQIEEYRNNGQLYKIDTIEERENSFKYVWTY